MIDVAGIPGDDVNVAVPWCGFSAYEEIPISIPGAMVSYGFF
jgi:hypothetical protein